MKLATNISRSSASIATKRAAAVMGSVRECERGTKKTGHKIPHIFRMILINLLTVALLMLMASPAFGAQGQAATGDKEEVIYSKLAADGSVGESYVVNHFKVESAGTVEDFGKYDSVQNLTTSEQITTEGDKIISSAKVGDFYYEGTIDAAAMPWQIDIGYKLDGRAISAEQLAGKSGRLEIDIQTAQNAAAADASFFENYLLQIQLSLGSDKATHIVAEGATVASAGKIQEVAFMVMPGKTGQLTLSAEVRDFEMAGMRVSAVPFTMVFDVPDTSAMLSDMSELSEAIASLSDGMSELEDGMAQLEAGAEQLEAGSGELKSALWQLSDSAVQLDGASEQINTALVQISEQLNAGMIDPEQVTQLVGGLRVLSAGLSSESSAAPGLAQGLAQVQAGIGSGVQAMDTYIAELEIVAASDVGALFVDPGYAQLLDSSKLTVQGLVDVNTAAAYVQGAWYGTAGAGGGAGGGGATDGIKAGIEGAASGLAEPISACNTMSGQLAMFATGLEGSVGSLNDLKLLAAYMQQLSGEFSTFSDGLGSYSDGVATLAENYSSFDEGLKSYLKGTDGLYGGIAALSAGTSELHINTQDLPEQLQTEIDAFIADYQGGDFTPVSFVSAKNEHVERVQFVMIGEPIEAAEPDATAVPEPPQLNFWQRLLALFGL